uniref:UBA domain-containing protein n=1 Tax=Anopheles maculatus TaxID=74869 RepID=A0A182SDR5_9DIPT
MDDIKGVQELQSVKEDPVELLSELTTIPTISSAAQQNEMAFNEEDVVGHRPLVGQVTAATVNSPKAIVMISAPPMGMTGDSQMASICRTDPDSGPSNDGWGCQHVNQDTNWEVPGSPEPQGGAASTGGTGSASAKPDGGGAHGAGPNGSWKAQNMNTGTELWETNLRSGGPAGPHLQQQQQQQAQQHLAQAKTTPWVPVNNLGGTWMEDDDGGAGGAAGVPEPSGGSVWNGSAAAIVAGAVPLVGPGAGPTPAWGALNNGNVVTATQAASGAVATVGGGMWPPGTGSNTPALTTAAGVPTTANNPQMAAIGVKKDLNEWGTGGVGPVGAGTVPPGAPGIIPTPSGAGGGWDGRQPGVTGAGGTLPMVGGGGTVGAVNGQSAGGFNINAASLGADTVLRGDPRGISGRLNGAAAAAAAAAAGGSMWGVGSVPDQRSGAVLPGAGVGGGQQWGNGNGGGPNKLPPTANWDDGRPSSLDEATGAALWGQGNGVVPLSRQNSAGWKDVADVMMRPGGGAGGGGPMQRNPVQGAGPFGPVPVPSGGAPGNGGVRGTTSGAGALSLGKDVRVEWGRQMQGIARNGSWDDQPPGGGWGDEKAGGAPWNMDLASNAGGWNKTPTTPKSAGLGWPDPSELGGGTANAGMDWGLDGGKAAVVGGGPTKSPLEFIRASKEYRLLCEMGHKKEDVEFALRTTNMNIDDAMELLRHGAGAGGLTGGGWRRTLSEDHAGAVLGMGGFDGAYSGRIPPLNHAASGLSYSQ